MHLNESENKKSFTTIILSLFKICIHLFKNDKYNFVKYISLKQLFLHLKYWTKQMSSSIYSNDESNLQLNVQKNIKKNYKKSINCTFCFRFGGNYIL